MNSQAEELPADLDRRFGGLARLYGTAGARRIRQGHIVIVGLGGVGSWAAEAAARSGVARLTLVDFDHIAESNINRQVHATTHSVGMAKVEAMRRRIADIHPDCRVDCVEAFAEPSNWPGVLQLEQEREWAGLAVIDACDQIKAKTAIAAWSMQRESTFISVGAAGGKRLAHKVDIADLSLVTHDPLLAQLRYRLRKDHQAMRGLKNIGVVCVFSREPVIRARVVSDGDELIDQTPSDELVSDFAPTQAQSDATLNCHGYGSVVSVTATFGLCAAGWVLSRLADGNLKKPKV